VLKFDADGELVLAVRAALRGERHVSRRIACSPRDGGTPPAPRDGLAGSTASGRGCPGRRGRSRGFGDSS
jgi:hypothetical protein